MNGKIDEHLAASLANLSIIKAAHLMRPRNPIQSKLIPTLMMLNRIFQLKRIVRKTH